MRIIDVMIAILLICALGVGTYTFLAYYYSNDATFNPFSGNRAKLFDETTFTKGIQFYPNMRFSDRKISYRLESACNEKKWGDIRRAFASLEENTILEFYESASKPDIVVLCEEEVREEGAEEKGYFIAGEGGPTEAINMSDFTVISGGKISLYKDEKCENPQVAIHEILHALGFGHVNDTNSIMYPISSCEQEIDSEILQKINSLYAIKSASDLLIDSITANKTGRYLNFEIWVANYGLRESGNATLIIYSENSETSRFNLGYLEIGMRKKLAVTNLKIPIGAERIRFVVATEENTDEIDLANNDAEISALGA